MPELIETAHAYALHSVTCKKCSNINCRLCPDGRRLLAEFYKLLCQTQRRQTEKGGFDS